MLLLLLLLIIFRGIKNIIISTFLACIDNKKYVTDNKKVRDDNKKVRDW